jgi:hypothetical protein
MAKQELPRQRKANEAGDQRQLKKKPGQLLDQTRAVDESPITKARLVDGLPVHEHARLLASAHSYEQLQRMAIQLQQSYGNAYVQSVIQRIDAARGSGQPLESHVCSEMENTFGQDFSQETVVGASSGVPALQREISEDEENGVIIGWNENTEQVAEEVSGPVAEEDGEEVPLPASSSVTVDMLSKWDMMERERKMYVDEGLSIDDVAELVRKDRTEVRNHMRQLGVIRPGDDW